MMHDDSEVTQFTDILSDEEFDKLEELLYRPKWGYTHKSTADDRWRRWRMELKDDEFFTKFFFEKIKTLTDRSFLIKAVYANGQTYGQNGSWHQDSTEPNYYAFIFYANREWDMLWGGSTLFNSGISIYPIPNSAVFFPCNIFHYGQEPTRHFEGLRMTVAYKLEETFL